MATTEATPDLNVVNERATYCLVRSEGPEGKEVITFMTESAAAKAVEKKEGEIVATQSFLKPQVNGFAGIQELFASSEKEAAKLTNRGIDQKAYQHIRARMLEQNDEGEFIFQAQEGDVDLTEFVATESASRATSPEAKLEKVLDGVDEATAIALLQKLMARMQGQPAA